MGKKERICQLIPHIEQIQDKKLREMVIEVWVKSWEESEWEDVADCPFNLDIQNCSIIEHTNFVITTATAMASFARDTWHIPIDIDALLAGAILHDVCKVVEHAPQKGALGKISAIGKNLVHGAYGVHLALNAGLPLKVVHMIGTHTPQVSAAPEIIEGVYICYADHAAADTFYLGMDKPMVMQRPNFKFNP